MYKRTYFIMGTSLEYTLSRKFVEEVNTTMNGKGKTTAAMIVNSLGERKDFISRVTKAKPGDILNIIFNGVVEIKIEKKDVNELKFFDMRVDRKALEQRLA